MARVIPLVLLVIGLLSSIFFKITTPAHLTAEEIVQRNVAARGGLDAWRKVNAMVWVGRIETVRSGAPPKLPFLLAMQRPNKTRFEIAAANGRAVRVFDGHEGWKLHPTDTGQPDLQPYSSDELKLAADGQGFEWPLLDCQARGLVVSLAGSDDIEGHKAYRLDIRLPSGMRNTVWVDASTFLDVQTAREMRSASGGVSKVISMNRDFRLVRGLRIPFTVETGIGATLVPDRMIIERVAFDPPLGSETFERPQIAGKRTVVSVRAMPESPTGYAQSAGRPNLDSAAAEAGISAASGSR